MLRTKCLVATLLSFWTIALAAPTSNLDRIQARIETLVAQARPMAIKKDWDAIVTLLRPEAENLNREGLLLLAKALHNQTDYLDEVRLLSNVTIMDPKDYVAWSDLGRAQAIIKKPADAEQSFRNSFENNPNYRPAYDGLIEVYQEVKNWYELRILLDDVIKRFGESPKLLTLQCKTCWHDHYQEGAILFCHKAVLKDPKVPENHLYLALAFQETENEIQAQKIFKKTAEDFPKSEFAQWKYATILAEKKNWFAAYKYFSQALKADPSSERSLIGVAESGFELQKYQESLDLYVKACRLNRSYLHHLKKALQVLKAQKSKIWVPKYEVGIEKCG